LFKCVRFFSPIEKLQKTLLDVGMKWQGWCDGATPLLMCRMLMSTLSFGCNRNILQLSVCNKQNSSQIFFLLNLCSSNLGRTEGAGGKNPVVLRKSDKINVKRFS